MSAEVARKLREQRRKWHELDDPPRRAIRIERPLDVELLGRSLGTNEAIAKATIDQVVDWRGFTEADLLGATVGGSDLVPFSFECFHEWAGDHTSELAGASKYLMHLITEHSKVEEEARKN